MAAAMANQDPETDPIELERLFLKLS